MDKKCLSSQVVLMQVTCFLRKRMVIREGDSKIRVSPNTQMGKSLFIVFTFHHWVSWGLPRESAEGAIPQEISAREVLAGLEGFSAGPWSSLSAPPPSIGLPHPTPHASNHFVAAAHTFVPLGHSPSRSRGCAPSLAPLGTCHPLLLVARVLSPLPPIFTGAPEHLWGPGPWGPESGLGPRRAPSPLPLGKPREVTPGCASLVAGPLAESLRAVEAAQDRDSPRSGRRNWAGRTPQVTLGAARLAKRRPPPPPPTSLRPGGSSCSSGNCSHPAPGSGYSPPPSASRARRRNPDSSLQRVLSRCAKLGVWKLTETRLLSRPSKPEPRLRSIALLGTLLRTELRLLEQIPFLRWRCVKTRGESVAL